MASETFSGQESALSDISVDPNMLLDLCCGCVDDAPPCFYCSLHKKGELSVRKFRQVPGKVYGNHTNEEGSCSSMVCETTFTSFRIHGSSSSFPLVSLLDPLVDISYPPAGVKDPCTLSICRRGPGNINELWYITATTEAEACDWYSVLKAPRPKHGTASCLYHMKVQRFLMRSSGSDLPDPASDSSTKQARSYWAAADRFAGLQPSVYVFITKHCASYAAKPVTLHARAGIASVMLKLTPWSSWAKAAHNIVYGIHLTTNLRSACDVPLRACTRSLTRSCLSFPRHQRALCASVWSRRIESFGCGYVECR
jgi:hypothetical protein